MSLNLTTATAWSVRAQAWQGGNKRQAKAKKYAVSATSAIVVLPVNADGRPPDLIRFSLPAGAKVYAEFGEDLAVAPTTSVEGSVEIRDGDVASPWGADRVALVAEAGADVTISCMWG